MLGNCSKPLMPLSKINDFSFPVLESRNSAFLYLSSEKNGAGISFSMYPSKKYGSHCGVHVDLRLSEGLYHTFSVLFQKVVFDLGTGA